MVVDGGIVSIALSTPRRMLFSSTPTPKHAGTQCNAGTIDMCRLSVACLPMSLSHVCGVVCVYPSPSFASTSKNSVGSAESNNKSDLLMEEEEEGGGEGSKEYSIDYYLYDNLFPISVCVCAMVLVGVAVGLMAESNREEDEPVEG